jgi:hypothetical protein
MGMIDVTGLASIPNPGKTINEQTAISNFEFTPVYKWNGTDFYFIGYKDPSNAKIIQVLPPRDFS